MNAVIKTGMVTVRLSEGERAALEQAAAEEDRSVSWCVRKAIEAWLRERENGHRLGG